MGMEVEEPGFEVYTLGWRLHGIEKVDCTKRTQRSQEALALVLVQRPSACATTISGLALTAISGFVLTTISGLALEITAGFVGPPSDD